MKKEELLKQLLDDLHENGLISEAADWGREIYDHYMARIGYIPSGVYREVVAALGVACEAYPWACAQVEELKALR